MSRVCDCYKINKLSNTGPPAYRWQWVMGNPTVQRKTSTGMEIYPDTKNIQRAGMKTNTTWCERKKSFSPQPTKKKLKIKNDSTYQILHHPTRYLSLAPSAIPGGIRLTRGEHCLPLCSQGGTRQAGKSARGNARGYPHGGAQGRTLRGTLGGTQSPASTQGGTPSEFCAQM